MKTTIALLLAALALATPGRGEQLTLHDIVENVRGNEALYDDLDVQMRTQYSISPRPPTNDSEVISTELQAHCVSQHGKFRLDIEGATNTAKETQTRDRIRAFDGAMTRLYDQHGIGNLIHARSDDENFVRPHMMFFRELDYMVPLSTLLSGDEALRAHPHGERWRNGSHGKMVPTYEGEDDVDGLACHKVRIVTLVKTVSGDKLVEFGCYMLWLAEARNYLPVRILSFGYRWSNDVPDGEGSAADLREIAPGIWFPFQASFTAYDGFVLQRTAKQQLRWRESYLVEQASLEPDYPPSYFSDVEFPDGTAMYEVVNGQTVNQYRQGGPGAPNAAGTTAERSSAWRVGLLVLLLATAVAFLVRWVRLCRRRQPNSVCQEPPLPQRG